MPNDPSPFMFAQALHVLRDSGQEHPTKDTAGLAFMATMLSAGYRRHELTKATMATRATANTGKDPYTGTKFKKKFLEAMRPGINERQSANKIQWTTVKRKLNLDEIITQIRLDDKNPEAVADKQLTDSLEEAVNHTKQALKPHHAQNPQP